MSTADKLRFDHDERQRVYRHVERRGVVTRERLEEQADMDQRALRHHTAILLRDGFLTEDEGGLRIGLSSGDPEQFDGPGVRTTIRPARQEDLGGIVGAIESVVADGTDVEAESVAHVMDYEAVVLRWNELESRMFFVATVDHDVVGWVAVRGNELEKLAHTAELTVGVLEAYRGEGIGTRLLERAIEWAREHGFERLYQSLPVTNTSAIEFLQARDWEVEAVRAGHYRIDGEAVDEVMLAFTT